VPDRHLTLLIDRALNGSSDFTWLPHRDGGLLICSDREEHYADDEVQVYAYFASCAPWAAARHRNGKWRRNIGRSSFRLGVWASVVEHHRARRRGEQVPYWAPPAAQAEAYESFLATIEPATLAVLRAFGIQSFRLLSAARRCPGLLDLLAQHGDTPDLSGHSALGYEIAFLHRPGPTHCQPLQTMKSIVRMEPRDMAVALGFPRETADVAVRALGHLERRWVHCAEINSIRWCLQRGDPHTRMLLATAELLTSEVTALIAYAEYAACVTPNFLRDLATPPTQRGWVPQYILEDVLRLRRNRGAGTPMLDSLDDLRQLHREESRSPVPRSRSSANGAT